MKSWIRSAWVLIATTWLSACVSVGIGNEVPVHAHYLLRDNPASMPRLAMPLVEALLIQPLPADAMADTVSMAYSRRPNEFAYYQFATWTERPVRQLPRLLQRRLEARGLAGAVGVIGEPLRADWMLAIGIDTLHHDVATPPGQARLALTAEVFDRRTRTRLARRTFAASVPTPTADAPSAARAMSGAVTQVFDDLVPWLETTLEQAPKPPR